MHSTNHFAQAAVVKIKAERDEAGTHIASRFMLAAQMIRSAAVTGFKNKLSSLQTQNSIITCLSNRSHNKGGDNTDTQVPATSVWDARANAAVLVKQGALSSSLKP